MAKIAMDSKINNDQFVVAEAQNLLRLINEVDAAEKEENNTRAKIDIESSVSTGRIHLVRSHFENVIKKNFQERFLAFGGNGLNENQRIDAIFLEIKKLIFEDILQDKYESKQTKEWLSANEKALLDQNHKQHQEAMKQSRDYLNKTNNYRHAAWRNFDPNAPKHDLWNNLFVGPQADRDCRLMLAYYYLVVTDKTQTQEQIRNGINNLITELEVIRRAHPRDNKEDSPSCYSGTIGRLVEMGRYHPVAVFPLHYSEFLSEIIRDILKIKLKEAFGECKSFHEKAILLKALKTFEDEDGLSKIVKNQLYFPRALLDIRYHFISRFSSTSKLMAEINKKLAARNVAKKLDDRVASQKNKINSMIYSPWKFAHKDIEAVFKASLNAEELTKYERENGIINAEESLKEPYADTILKQILQDLEGQNNNVINFEVRSFMISKLAWECIANKLDANQRNELSSNIGFELRSIKEDKEIRKVIGDLVGTKLKGIDSETLAKAIFDRINGADLSPQAINRIKTQGSAVSATTGFGNTAATPQPAARASSVGDVKSAVDSSAVSAMSKNVDVVRQQSDFASTQQRKHNITNLVSKCLRDKLDKVKLDVNQLEQLSSAIGHELRNEKDEKRMGEIIRILVTNMFTGKGYDPSACNDLADTILASITKNPDPSLNDKELHESAMSSYHKRIANQLPKEIQVVIHDRTPIARVQAEIREQQAGFLLPARNIFQRAEERPWVVQQQAHLLQLAQIQLQADRADRDHQALMAGLHQRAEAARNQFHALQLAQQQRSQAQAAAIQVEAARVAAAQAAAAQAEAARVAAAHYLFG